MFATYRCTLTLFTCALLAVPASFARAGSETADEGKQDDSGWIVLLSPETKQLGEHWETTGNWTIEEGVATLTPREGEKGWSRFSAYLWSKKQYGDFVVEFDYRLPAQGNSGFYFRVGDRDDPVQQGIEVQLYESASKPEGAKLTDHDAGGIIPGVPPAKRASRPAGEWNTMRVESLNDKLVVTLNGVRVNSLDLSQGPLANRPRKGWIGFQDHGLPMALRNIRIRPAGE